MGAIAVFNVFHIRIFSKMVGKHANRIAGYVEDKIAFWRFFDASGYIMMAIMMNVGSSVMNIDSFLGSGLSSLISCLSTIGMIYESYT